MKWKRLDEFSQQVKEESIFYPRINRENQRAADASWELNQNKTSFYQPTLNSQVNKLATKFNKHRL